MDYNEATKLLDDIRSGMMPDSETALVNAITVYRELAARVKTIEAQQARAKETITEIMQETGQVKAITSAGTAQFTADSVRVSYDTKAIDALVASDDGLARLLTPHRKETAVKGSLTIK
jgi:protoporphyrinogen oxidase